MEVDRISTCSVGVITGGRDIVVLFFTNVKIICSISGRIKLPLVSGASAVVHNDVI